MELPIFLLNDTNGGVSAYHDRATLDAAVISADDGAHLAAWGSDGERLTLSVTDDRWSIAPDDPRVFDLELLIDELAMRLKYWDLPTAPRVSRDRIVERAAIYFNVKATRSRWEALTGQLLGGLFNPPSSC